MLIADSPGEGKPNFIFTLPAARKTSALDEGSFVHQAMRVVLDLINPATRNDFSWFVTSRSPNLSFFEMADQAHRKDLSNRTDN